MTATKNIIQIEKAINSVTQDVEKLSDNVDQLSQKFGNLMTEYGQVSVAESTLSNGTDPLILAITVFVLACFVGYYVVWKVTPALHTPLMSVTNAISGIIIVGAMLAAGSDGISVAKVLGFLAVLIASINIFGGFIVTNRMLEMFRKK
jgi:NAD(P) transhydrogenase subunit alpha